jgi:hypothetical protein
MGDVSRCSLYAKCEVTRCVPAVIGDCGVVQGVRVIEIGEPKLRRGVPPRGEILIDEQPACEILAKSGML